MTPEQREEFRKRQEERLKSMTPDERAAYETRMRERAARGGGGRDSSAGGGRGNAGGGRQDGERAATAAAPAQGGERQPRPAAAPVNGSTSTGATTIDQLFAPIPVSEGRGRVWLFVEKQLKPISVRTGISDGTWTEIIETPDTAPLKEGTEVVTNVVTGLEPKTTPGQTGAGSPLMPQRGQPGRGNQPGGGGGRGR